MSGKMKKRAACVESMRMEAEHFSRILSGFHDRKSRVTFFTSHGFSCLEQIIVSLFYETDSLCILEWVNSERM